MSERQGADVVQRRVLADDAGIRLDVWLARQPEVPSRSVARSLIDRHLVTLGSAPPKASHAVAPGDLVSFRLVSETESSPVDAPPLEVLYEDAYLLVIDKPPGLAAHPPESRRGVREPSVAGLALARCPDLPRNAGPDRPGIVHRLDKDTSGVMVLAKTEEAFFFVQSQFKARTVAKEYRAICYGEARFDSDWIERNLASHPLRGDRVVVVREGGRQASTFYEVVERFAGFTHFRCRPRTGRTHQIRVHMAAIGHTLVGERVYRTRAQANARLPVGAPDPGRQCLHALRIGIRHPRTHEALEFEAPMREDMRALLRWLEAERRR